MYPGKDTLKEYLKGFDFSVKAYDTNCLIIIKGECSKEIMWDQTSGCSTCHEINEISMPS